jgi:hypothetical protein
VIATQRIGRRGAQLVLWGEARSVGDHGEEIAALIEGLTAGAEKATETPPGSYVDRRVGISVSMPVDWRMVHDTPPEVDDIGTFVTWEKEGRWLGVLGMCVPRGLPTPWAAAFLEQRLRSRLGPQARALRSAATRPVAAREASATSWHAPLEHVDVIVLNRDNTLVAIASVDHGDAALEKAIDGFSFVD